MSKFYPRSFTINDYTYKRIVQVSEERGISLSEALRTLVEFGWLFYMELIERKELKVKEDHDGKE